MKLVHKLMAEFGMVERFETPKQLMEDLNVHGKLDMVAIIKILNILFEHVEELEKKPKRKK